MEERLHLLISRFLCDGLIVRWDLKVSEDLFKEGERKTDLHETLGAQYCLASCLARKLKGGDSRREAESLAEDILKTRTPLDNFFERFEPLYTKLKMRAWNVG